MLDLMTEYTSFAGRMLPLPDWVSDGVIIGVHGGKQRVQETLTNLKNHDIPVAAVLVEDWTGEYLQNTEKEDKLTRQWWNWENDEDTYPSWPSFVDEVRKETRVMTYINPFLSDVSLKSRFQKNLFVEAREMGYLVKGIHDEKYLSIQIGLGVEVGLLDLTNPETRAWFKEILKKQVWNSDISGINHFKMRQKQLSSFFFIGMMVDFGEYLPCDTNVALHSGESASTYHNMYPEDWAQLHREVMIELGKEQDAVCFFRSGYIHSPGHMNLFWSGDQNVSWDQNYGLRSVVS